MKKQTNKPFSDIPWVFEFVCGKMYFGKQKGEWDIEK
jgi:hypothetical protein